MKAPPKLQVDRMPASEFFGYAAELFKVHPPHLTDQPIVAQMKKVGIEPGKSFDITTVDPAIQRGLDSAPRDAQKLMAWKVPSIARVANGWSMNTDTMGVYGNYYLKRAIVAQLGLGANLPEDAIYPLNLGDETGAPLDGANKYTIHFDKGATPPVNAFWSLTLYDNQTRSMLDTPQRYPRAGSQSYPSPAAEPDAGGSTTVYFSPTQPAGVQRGNWIQTMPGKGWFTLLRLYSPLEPFFTKEWRPSEIEEVGVGGRALR